MDGARHRKKQPELVRAQLLRAAAELVVRGGTAAVTLDAVAARANVTKGGLQYHFRSKQLLLDALLTEVSQGFLDSLHARYEEDPEPRGREARAYLRATVSSPDAEDNGVMRALMGSMLLDPDLREHWGDAWLDASRLPSTATGKQRVHQMVCQLAADGLWFSELLGDKGMTPDLKAAVVRRLEDLSRE
jgi:AcrR family transcriptional regulator